MSRKGWSMAVLFAATIAGGTALGVWLTIQSKRNQLVWDHWDVVVPGAFYRSGQLERDQLAEAIRRHRIKTVINLQYYGTRDAMERELAGRLGIDYKLLPMPGDGFGQEAQFRQVLQTIEDPKQRPVLVHCARGTCRTGAAVALYRFEHDGWTLADVAAEMRRQSYREGWIPGYVFAMLKPEDRADMQSFAPVEASEPVRSERIRQTGR